MLAEYGKHDGSPLHHFSNNVALTDVGKGNLFLACYHHFFFFLRLKRHFCQRFVFCFVFFLVKLFTHLRQICGCAALADLDIKPRQLILTASYVTRGVMRRFEANAQLFNKLAEQT